MRLNFYKKNDKLILTMKKIYTLFFILISFYTFGQELNYKAISQGEIVLITNQKITFSKIEDQGDKILYTNAKNNQQGHIYKNAIKSINEHVLNDVDVAVSKTGATNLVETSSTKDLKTVDSVEAVFTTSNADTAVEAKVNEKQNPRKLSYLNSNKIYNGSVKLTNEELQNTLKENAKALKLYNSGVTQKKVSNYLLGFGGGLIIGNGLANLIHANKNDDIYSTESSSRNTSALFIVGGGFMAAGLVLKITGPSAIRNSISEYNTGNSTVVKLPKPSLNVLVSNDGAGLRLSF